MHHPTNPQPQPFDQATDPALDALLDAALQPEPWPTDARQRTRDAVWTTNRQLSAAEQDDAPPPRPAVLARIGVAVAWGLAAVLALGTVAVVLQFSSRTPPTDPGTALVENPTNDAQPTAALAALHEELDAWAQTAQAGSDDDAWLDSQLDLLDTQVALTSSETLWSHDDAWGSLEVADLHRELDALADPMGRTF